MHTGEEMKAGMQTVLAHGRILRTVMGKAVLHGITAFILLSTMITTGGCASIQTKDEISNLSFSADGKKVLFDRCRGGGCQIQVYDLETGELAAYQSPKNERWTMARQSYDGKRIVFSVIPIVDGGLELGDMQIAVMDVDGKNRRTITTGPGAKIYPVFSHSGTKVLYARAGYMRKQGHTPAADYDAWEVDLMTGSQTQLTFFKYYYMGNLTYFPDDERFIYYGSMPDAFPGLDLPKDNPDQAQEMIKQAQIKNDVGIGGVIIMKKGDALPREHYTFGTGFFAKCPLLSKDGSRLIVEKDMSAGKFFLYSPDGNHRLAVNAGPSVSVAISPDGNLIAVIPASSTTLHTYTVSDGKGKHHFYLAYALKIMKNYEESIRKYERLHGEKFIMMPDKPSIILNN